MIRILFTFKFRLIKLNSRKLKVLRLVLDIKIIKFGSVRQILRDISKFSCFYPNTNVGIIMVKIFYANFGSRNKIRIAYTGVLVTFGAFAEPNQTKF